ncbi:MAG: Txe/YoeB family addiction module toxin [Kiritimatiellaeota bacterium]|nr:Txe/YoeB family addiction module toxin [Kiritimatiellota bacterium]
MDISWKSHAWDEYLSWQNDKQMFRRINALLKDIQRSPFSGIGQPEELKYGWSGCWSRRIDEKHRIIYRIENGTVHIEQCRDHY